MHGITKQTQNRKKLKQQWLVALIVCAISFLLCSSGVEAAGFDLVTGQPNLPSDAKIISGQSGSFSGGSWAIYSSVDDILYGSYLVVEADGAIPDYKRPSSGCGGYAPWYTWCVDNNRHWNYLYKAIIFRGNVTKIGQAAFCEQYDLRCPVIIPDTVTSIGASAFAVCDKISYVYIPDSVTSIGENAIHVTVPIKCSSASTAYQYAKKNGNKMILTDGKNESESQTEETKQPQGQQNQNTLQNGNASGETTGIQNPNPTVSTGADSSSKVAPSLKLKKKSNKKLVISFGKIKSAKGYQIQYATNKKFSSAKIKTVSSKKQSITLSVKRGKTYYVRVRSKLGKTTFGKWSTRKKIRI